jgi:urease accessory protein UreE
MSKSRATEIAGNVYADPLLRQKYQLLLEKDMVDELEISRREAIVARFRKKTKKGKDAIVNMERGTMLHHGDILSIEGPSTDEILVVEIAPEEVLMITVKADVTVEEQIEAALKLGYALGNKHIQVYEEGRNMQTPTEGEKEVVLNAISGIENLDVKIERIRLEPREPIHEH